jgi:hypothetical protein
MKTRFFIVLAFISFQITSCTSPDRYDLIVHNAKIIDGSGEASYLGVWVCEPIPLPLSEIFAKPLAKMKSMQEAK